MLEEAEETVGAVPAKADPRTEQGIPRRQPQRIVSKEEWQGAADLRDKHGLDDETMRSIMEKAIVNTKSGKPDRINFTKYYEEILEAKKQKEQEPPSRFKEKLGLTEEQDNTLKQMRLDKIKPENRSKLIALMQLLEDEDKGLGKPITSIDKKGETFKSQAREFSEKADKDIDPAYVEELRKRGVELVDKNLDDLIQVIRTQDKAKTKA